MGWGVRTYCDNLEYKVIHFSMFWTFSTPSVRVSVLACITRRTHKNHSAKARIGHTAAQPWVDFSGHTRCSDDCG